MQALHSLKYISQCCHTRLPPLLNSTVLKKQHGISLNTSANRFYSHSTPFYPLKNTLFSPTAQQTKYSLLPCKNTPNPSIATIQKRFISIPKRLYKHLVIAGKVSPPQPVPSHIKKPPYATSGFIPEHDFEGDFEIKTEEEIDAMRKSCQLAKKILDYAATLVVPGVTTDEIDTKVHQAIIDHNAYPSPLNYSKYPKSICTSVNEIIAHGIPDDRPLQDGDIITIDITVYYEGFHGDTARTFLVGELVDDNARRLVEVAKQCLDSGIAAVKPGKRVREIGKAVSVVAKRAGFRVIPPLCGHGIGREFHTRPYVFPCGIIKDRSEKAQPWKGMCCVVLRLIELMRLENDYKGILEPGMTFTIEPVVAEKGSEYTTWDDGWTMSTKDGGWTAQFEHTVLVTDDGVEVLTQ